MHGPFGDVIRAVGLAMAETGSAWYLFGAQAATLWGRPRLTADVDVTANVPHDRLPSLIATMARHGFTLRFADDEFVAQTRVLPFVHSPTGVPLDVVLSGPGLEDEFLARAIEVDFDGTPVPVISPEDLIITKVLAGRSKDVEDIRGVLRERSGTLDIARIRAILLLLENALGQSDLLTVFEAEMSKFG